MAQWTVDMGSHWRIVSEAALRTYLRERALSGLEMVKPPGALVWEPLYDTDIFREEVSFTGSPEAAAQKRRARREFTSAGLLMVFAAINLLWNDSVAWLLALLCLGGAISLLFLALDRTRKHAAATSETASAEGQQDFPDDIQTIRERRRALESAIAASEPDALWEELARARTLAAEADRDKDREAFEAHAASLEEHLRALQDARRARDRLAAGERALLHNTEALRLARLGSGIDAMGPATVARERLEAFRATLAAESEVEDVLERARRAAAWEHAR